MDTVRTHFRTVWFAPSEVDEKTSAGRTTVYDGLKALAGRGLDERHSGKQGKEYRLSDELEETFEPSGTVRPDSPETVRPSPPLYRGRTERIGGVRGIG